MNNADNTLFEVRYTRVSLNTGSSTSEVWEKDTVAVANRDTVEL